MAGHRSDRLGVSERGAAAPAAPGICLPSRSLPAGEAVRLAVLAEELGFGGVWFSEVANLDGVAILGAIAQATEAIGIGSAVIPVASRSAAVLAMAGATLESLAPGRVTLGLGVSSATIVEGWHGREFGSALESVRDCVTILRQAWSGEPTRHLGGSAHSQGFRLDPSSGGAPRLYLAALGPRMRRLAAELADGVILNFLPRTRAAEVVAGLEPARKGYGAAALVRVADEELAPGAVARVRKEVASYLRIPQYRAWLEECGLSVPGGGAGAGREWVEEKASSLPEEFVADSAVIGGVDECYPAFAELSKAGVAPLAVPVVEAGDIEAFERVMRGIAASAIGSP
ncbi:MAG: LLM class flavin-dependent oxidoreductase [Actinomycetota bacterium]|nr:LLM class flavin-dependent oxidoreductase [Actinomycetota bacterium]